MPNLEMKNGTRRWRGSVMVNGKQKRRWFPDDTRESKREATAWELSEREAMVLSPVEQEPTPTICSPLEWGTRYLADAEGRLSKSTFNEKRTALRKLLEFLVSKGIQVQGVSVSVITTQVALEYLSVQNRSRSGYAANKDRKNLVRGWNWAKKYISNFPVDAKNPFDEVEKFREIRSPRDVPSEDDFWKVVEVAQGQDKVMLLAFIYLGARRKEIFGMTWDDVDFEQGRIRLWTNKREGAREFDWLPMAEKLKTELMAWKNSTPFPEAKNVFVATWDTCSPTHSPGVPFSSRQHLMARLCRQAGVAKFTFHAIRHLTAVTLHRDGFRIGLIQKLLRHTKAQTTEIYLRSLGIDMEEVRVAVNGMGDHRGRNGG